jgi:hypothetical protein
MHLEHAQQGASGSYGKFAKENAVHDLTMVKDHLDSLFQHFADSCRVPYDFVPHGNFFNNLPAVPDDVRRSMPQQDGSISWSRQILAHNKDLYLQGHPMV